MSRLDIPDIEIIDLEDDRAADENGNANDGEGSNANNGGADEGSDRNNGEGSNANGGEDSDRNDSESSNANDSGADEDSNANDSGADEGSDRSNDEDSDTNGGGKPSRRKKLPINIHIVLLAVVLLTFGYIFYKYVNFGRVIDPSDALTDSEDYVVESYDHILALTDEEGNVLAPNLEDGLSIAVFGNGPFAEDRDSEEGLAKLLAAAADAKVYNCSISGSLLTTTQTGSPKSDINPWDAFSFYWLALCSTDVRLNDFYNQALEALGDDAPPEAAEVWEILSTVDFDTIDVIVVMYDSSDYFSGRPAVSTEDIHPIQSFAGNLEGGLDVLRQHHPNARIIVMSPTYAFSDQLDENGDYISSDIVRYGGDNLSAYVSNSAAVCSAAQVSFVDNFYVTFNEDTAQDYLSDNMHLNAEGRKKVIERLMYALHYYDAFYQ
ncbi:MAG: GDSL-type esterase/lipase family protein [Butyrivibrio sp.]|nr:GDSL-type esterase/lipase family protein [Acetatifactor muris]MCM1559881.1 GDSL-type esterase/lipase family protein [Butyrivibrio sp.]